MTATGGDEQEPLEARPAEDLLARIAALPPGDPDRERLRGEVVEIYLPYVRAVARRYAHRGEPFDDVQQAGLVGLVKAINRFDPAIGDTFIHYAGITISGEIKRHFRDTTWTVRVSRRVQELRLALREATAAFHQQHGRAPTVQESAGLLDATEDEIIEVLNASDAYSPASLDAPSPDGETPVGHLVGVEESRFDLVSDLDAVMPLLNRLPERERTILTLRFWGNKTQSEIAEELGISQMHVSRLLSTTLAKLRSNVEDPAF